MKRRLFLIALVIGILVLALGGWSVQGLRWLATGSPQRRPTSGAWKGRAPQTVMWARPAAASRG